jgi:TRAP-type C4-dicarboxylate transport system substrate-binding protein
MKGGISMKSKRSLVVFLSFVVLLTFFVFPISTPAQDVIEIKANTFHPVGHRLTEDAFKWYGNEIEKRTNGKVKFKWFLGASLVPQFKTYDAIKSGICDWGYIITSLNPNEFVITDAINLPFMADSSAHAAAIGWKMYQKFPELNKEYDKVKLLFFYSTAAVHVHTKGPAPKKLEDLKGLRLGTPGPPLVKIFKLLGAAAQQMQAFDLYTALQRGMIDGIIFPEAPLRSYKLTDVVGHHTLMSIGVDVFATMMNLNTWKSLPPDVKKVFEDISKSAGALFGATITNESEWVIEELKQRGDEFYYLPDDEKDRWRKILRPVYDGWVERVNRRGLNGKEMLETIMAISNETRKNPYKPDSWWGRAGRK